MSQSGSSFSFKGSSVFSSTGAGSNLPHAPSNKLYWLVRSLENGDLTIQPLVEREWRLTGSARPISVRELQSGEYKPEPDLYRDQVLPRLHAQAGDAPLADFSKSSALQPGSATISGSDEIETRLRDLFGQARQMLDNGKLDNANLLFKQILGQDTHAQHQHRHVFNEFGIDMRKRNLRPQAIDFYTKALELCGDQSDENLHFNLARVLFEEDRYLACTQQLFKALRLDPDNWAVLRFLGWMQKRDLIPKQYQLEVQAKLKNSQQNPVPANSTLTSPDAASTGIPDNLANNLGTNLADDLPMDLAGLFGPE